MFQSQATGLWGSNSQHAQLEANNVRPGGHEAGRGPAPGGSRPGGSNKPGGGQNPAPSEIPGGNTGRTVWNLAAGTATMSPEHTNPNAVPTEITDLDKMLGKPPCTRCDCKS